MEKKRHLFLKSLIGLCLLLIMLIGRAAFGAVLWKGKLKVVSADPWKIEIIESAGPGAQATPPELLRPEKTGLPEVTEKHWICTGRLPSKIDIGWIYEFTGTIPDIGGCYSFEVGEQSLSFRSQWSQPSFLLVPLIITAVILVAVIVLAAYIYTKVAKK
jgi:hypothetical protein